MKIAITLATADALPNALVVYRDIGRSLPRIADLGYDGVEIYVFDGCDLDVAYTKRLLGDTGLEAPVFSVGQVFLRHGLTFTDPDPVVRDEAVRVFCRMVDLAGEFGADVNVSRMRGRIPPLETRQDTLERFTECMQRACARAAEHGTNILVEQMNRNETNYLCSVDDVAQYIRQAGIRNLQLHADTYHMEMEDPDYESCLVRNGHDLGYIHFSDTNRLPPGMGSVDFPGIIEVLNRQGYDRWVGVEVVANPSADTVAQRSIEYLRRFITRRTMQ